MLPLKLELAWQHKSMECEQRTLCATRKNYFWFTSIQSILAEEKALRNNALFIKVFTYSERPLQSH